MKKLENWFNRNFAWFFTNGNKTPYLQLPKTTKVLIEGDGKKYVIKNIEHLEFSLIDNGTTLKIKVSKILPAESK